jgi:cobalt-zinc-cadmium efflux system outer membrane protein
MLRIRFLMMGWLAAAVAPATAHDMDPDSMAVDTASGNPLAALVAHALAENPSLRAAQFEVKALHSSPEHAWYLDPPQVGVEFFETPLKSFPNPLRNQMEIDYSIQQAIPFPGKISSRRDAEHRHALMGEAELEALRRRVVREVKTDYYELRLLDKRLEFNAGNRALMGRLVEIARRQYEVGLGRQADILRAQTELTHLRADSITLAESRKAREGLLNALLNRKPGTALAAGDDPEPAGLAWTPEQAEALVEDHHPDLKALRQGIEMRSAEKTRAKREFLPDFMLAAEYKDMLINPLETHGATLQDYWSVGVSMSLPFAPWSFPKYRAAVSQGGAELERARQEYLDMRNALSARAREALLKSQSSRELARISRDILVPQARQALESALAGYQGGKGDLGALLDAYRMRLAAEENAEAAMTRELTSQAELEEAIGIDIPEISGGKTK